MKDISVKQAAGRNEEQYGAHRDAANVFTELSC